MCERRTDGERDMQRDIVGKYVGLCVFLISYTRKVTVIYAARLSPHLGAALVFSYAVCQSASTGSPCITDEGKKPASEPGSPLLKSCIVYWHTSRSLSTTSTHNSDTNH